MLTHMINRKMRDWGRGSRVFYALLLAAALMAPGTALAGFRTGLRLRLVEYSDPAYARRGTATELIYTGKQSPPYGNPYAVNARVKKRCHFPNLSLNGGLVIGWVSQYFSAPFAEDPYAEQAAVIPYGAQLGDGSRGRDFPCFQSGSLPTEGSLTIYARYQEYWNYDKTLGYHVVDILWCSNQLGCNWYYGYARNL